MFLQRLQQELGAGSVLHIGRMNLHFEQETIGVYEDVTLTTINLLATIIATRPPFSVVLLDWESMMAAEGVLFLPEARLSRSRKIALILSHTPVVCHARK